MLNLDKKILKFFDWPLFLVTILITSFGLMTIYAATVDSASGYIRYLKPQGAAFIMGLITIFVLLFIDYDFIGKLYLPIYGFTIILLILVLFTKEINGARSWISVAGITFQPSEIAKIAIIVCVGKFIDIHKETINAPLTLLKVLVFAFIPVGLILLENDFGTSMVCTFIIAIMLFDADLNWKYILSATIAVFISLPAIWFKLDGYQKKRILVFLDPSLDPSGNGYQVLQAKTAIGSGMLFGRGLSDAKFIKYGYLPENHTDMIFSVIGEVFGFAGGFILLCFYLIMFYRLIALAKESKDSYGSIVIMGILAMILFHVIENVGMNMGLMPVTGIPLPFVSYGGTSLLSNLLGIGLVLSIGIRRKHLLF